MWSVLVISLALVGAYADGDIPIDVDYDDDLIGLDSEMPGVCGPERWKTQGLKSVFTGATVDLTDCTSVRMFDLEYFALDGVEALVEAFSADPENARNINKITLTQCGIDEEAAAALIKGLAGTNVQILNLEDNNAGTDDAPGEPSWVFPVLQGLEDTNITSLQLGGNSLQEAGVTAIADWFADHGQIKNLSVERNMLGMPGVRALESMISNDKFEGIWLDDNKIDGSANNVVAEAIDGSDGFKYLSLDGNDIGADGLEHLLGADVELRYLSIQECKLGNAGAVIAAKYIETSPFAKELKHLNFGFNKVTDKGATAFALALQKDPPLEKLTLFANDITDTGVELLAEALVENTHLLEIDLEDNKSERGWELEQQLIDQMMDRRAKAASSDPELQTKASASSSNPGGGHGEL